MKKLWWRIELAKFDFDIVYRTAQNNYAPGALFIGVTRGSQRGHDPPNFSKNIVNLCFERRFSEQISAIRPKSTIVVPPNIFGAPKIFGWLRHWPCRGLITLVCTRVSFMKVMNPCVTWASIASFVLSTGIYRNFACLQKSNLTSANRRLLNSSRVLDHLDS